MKHTCRDCGNAATRKVTITRGFGRSAPSQTYMCCDNCEPRHIPADPHTVIRTDSIR